MNIGLYQSAASLSALERWQDAVSQNISGGQVPGYRGRTVTFSAQDNGQFVFGRSGQPGSDSSQPASFPAASSGISFKAGETQPTGNPLDLAIQGPGFFQVKMPDGARAYTRDGTFHQRADGTLVNSSNFPVLSESASPIVLALAAGPVSVTQEGVISQGDAQVAKLSVTSFSNTAALTPISSSLLLASPSAGAKPAEHPGVLQGYIESSNVSPLFEMVNL
ncbi:MAG TPA: flagellar hook basal-body protein, partial [Opitutaceae bacterium]|nr:flagellar hook basal-body protein [Opitutaceae bacterium]